MNSYNISMQMFLESKDKFKAKLETKLLIFYHKHVKTNVIFI